MVSSDEIRSKLVVKREGLDSEDLQKIQESCEPGGYLVCEQCSSYYELQPSESPEDFHLVCECGGQLGYKKSIDDVSYDDNPLLCPQCGNKAKNQECEVCGYSWNVDKTKSIGKTRSFAAHKDLRGYLDVLISFWNKNRRNKMVLFLIVFLICIGLFVWAIMPTEYDVGSSKFKLPDSYQVKGGYTADTTSKTELYSSESLISLEITQFSARASFDEYIYDLFINPDTMDRWNGHSGYSAYTSQIYNRKTVNINGTNVIVFEDRIHDFINNYFFEKNGKFFYVRVSYPNPETRTAETAVIDRTLQMIVSTIN